MSDFIVNNLFDGFILLALPLSILAGLISFASPCVLPLVPGYLSYAAGYSQARGRVLLGSILFVCGFSLLFVSYGVLFGGLGARIAVHEEMITHLLGFFTIALGAIFAGAFPMMPTVRPKFQQLVVLSVRQYSVSSLALVGLRASAPHLQLYRR